jgi:phosphatidylinositol alpha-1,6-mannosyltransferase
MIIVLTQCFPSRIGGIESLVSNLAIELGKKEKVLVFADRHHLFYDAVFDNQYKDKIIVRRTSGLKFFRRRKKIKELKPFIESKKVKLIIADTWKSLELGINYLNEKKIPTLCLVHGNELLTKDHKKLQRVTQTLERVSTIVANSQFTVNLVKNLIPNKGNIKFVYPGAIDLNKVKSDSFVEIKGSPVLITLARLEKRKGHEAILKAVKELTSEFPKIQYIIAGEGPEKTHLQQLVKKYLLESNVFFAGLVNDFQKKYLFECVDLMVMPTLDEREKRSIEGFGIAYLEAAFFGIPSIASDVGGTKEAVLHNKTGIIINNIDDIYQSIHNLLINPNQRKKLGENARKRAVEDFNWDIVIKKYLDATNN